MPAKKSEIKEVKPKTTEEIVKERYIKGETLSVIARELQLTEARVFEIVTKG